ncbi:MAG: type II secretion system protein N [Pacificimonas sp.]|nr:type II secretion system protein N [Pacificimonas sp.]
MTTASRQTERRFGVRAIYSAAELAAMALLAAAIAALFWAALAPIGPLGVWRANVTVPGAQATQFTGLDAVFGFRSNGGALAVSASDLSLFGVREDRATGRGSAIIGGEDQPQRSYAVGDEILRGLSLLRVERDHVVLARGGAEEALYLDESEPAVRVGGASGASPSTGPQRDEAAAMEREIALSVREGGGLIVQPGGSGDIFRRSGLQAGDALISLNGQTVSTPAEARRLFASARSGDTLALVLERRGTQVPLTVRVP